MILGALVLAAPISVAVLIWWWRSRRTRRLGKSLAIFLLGYALLLILNSLTDLAHEWSRPRDLSYYISFIFAVTVAGYFVGGLGWMVLGGLRESLLDALYGWLALPSRWVDVRASGERAVSSRSEIAAQDARQRAIEECAELAYEYVIENEAVTAADHDRAERAAARLRDAVLALGEKDGGRL
jgi:hypothetical protein